MDYKLTLKQIKALAKKGAFDQALQLTIALKQEHQSDQRLHRWINKFKVKAKNQEAKAAVNFIKNGIKTIKSLRKSKQFELAIKACDEIFEVDPDNAKVKVLRNKCAIDIVDQNLADQLCRTWEQQKEYEKLYLFYQKLLKVFPEVKKLKILIKATEQKIIIEDQKRKKAFSEASLVKINQMFAEGKYEPVIEACKELLKYTHQGSTEAIKLLKLAQKENEKEIEAHTYEFMRNQLPLLRKNYEDKTEPMIKL